MDSKNNALSTDFLNISEALTSKNYLVTVVFQNIRKDLIPIELFVDTPHFVAKFDTKSKELFLLDSSAIVFLDSVASLKKFNERVAPLSNFSMAQQVFVHCQDGTFDKVATIETDKIRLPIVQYEYFLVEDETAIRLLTFVWYTPEKCRKAQLIEVNRFNKSTRQWLHEHLKIDKFSNFHGCRIYFLLDANFPEFEPLVIDDENKTVTKCVGYTCAIVEDLSSALNYSYHMNYNSGEFKLKWPKKPVDLFVLSGSVTVKHTIDPKIDEVITRPVFYLEHFITVPPGEEYNEYEKLLLPFDEETWMWIGVTFATAFATIFVLRLVRSDIANFVMGEGTATPALNVFRAFFGISQIVCPSRNFARYLLMMFIIFSLIIRTAYQGKMFEFLQKEMRKSTVTTIDEMIEQNFTFYMAKNFKNYHPNLELSRRAKIIDDWTYDELFNVYKRTYIPGSKVAAFYKRDMYTNVVRNSLNRTDPPKLLKDRLMLEPRALVFPFFHFLFDIFDRKLQQYIEADLINYNLRDIHEKIDPKKYETTEEPFAVLTFAELEAGFVVSLAPLVLSVLVSGLEWMLTLKNLIVFLFIFKKYFDVKTLEQLEHSGKMKNKIANWQLCIRLRK